MRGGIPLLEGGFGGSPPGKFLLYMVASMQFGCVLGHNFSRPGLIWNMRHLNSHNGTLTKNY